MSQRDKKNRVITRDHNAVSKPEHFAIYHDVIITATKGSLPYSNTKEKTSEWISESISQSWQRNWSMEIMSQEETEKAKTDQKRALSDSGSPCNFLHEIER